MKRLLFNLCFLWIVGVASAGEPAWDLYNRGIEAYAKGEFTSALQVWQDLSLRRMPRGLERPVWFQLGNVHFRLGEPLESGAPEQAIELWRRSCEAYRSALAVKPRDRDVLHNLNLVQNRLARLAHRLGLEALRSAQEKPLDEAIDLLRTATESLKEAVDLAPEDREINHDFRTATRALQEQLKQRAQNAENKGDESARQTNPWADQQAEDQYRAALEDLKEAIQSTPQGSKEEEDSRDHSLTQAQERVETKLGQLLTRRGQQEQKQGDQQSESNAEQALGHYESALSLYQSAQEAQAGNKEAQKGEREVRLAMEKLYVKQGASDLQRGKEALEQTSPQAAANLGKALSEYEAALRLNESNAEARAGAEEARRLLPEALTIAGQAELAAGERAERRSVTDALTKYQEAQKDFQESLEMEPGAAPAEKGLHQAEESLSRLRQKAAQEAEAAAKAGQPHDKPPQTLQSLLGEVDEKKPLPESDRQRQRAQRSTRPRPYHADW